MQLKRLAKRALTAINIPLGLAGVELSRKGSNPSPFTRLAHLKKLGVRPKVIYDCGAYLGTWAVEVAKLFPQAQIVMFEPNTLILPKTKAAVANIQPSPLVIEAAVGDKSGTATLNVWDNSHTSMPGSSLLGHVQGTAGTKIETPVVTLDEIAEKHNLRPDIIKLDLQGFEYAALQGATSLLKTTEVVIIEFGLLEAYEGRTTPRQIIDMMYDNGYCLYDIVDLLYRPYDGALSSGDFFFVKNSSPLRKYKGYT